MTTNGKGKKAKYDTLREQIDIAEIKEGVVVLKDGSLRAVLAVSSLNFDLKSDEEQEAIIYGFQRFLNAIDFPLQILISTKKLDIEPYLKKLEKKRNRELNELLKNQISDYINFIRELVGVSNIMTTMFYIIVPFYLIESKQTGFWERISATFNPQKALYQKREFFETNKNQLFQRIEQVKEGLAGIGGLRAVPLNTAELIELFYNHYNPSEFEYVNLENLDSIELEN